MSEPGIELVQGVEGLRPEHGPLFAVIGVFDGLHLGHRYLLSCLVEEANRRAARPAVITFDSHPDEILVGAAPPLLLDPGERVRMLGEAGVEVVVIQHFDAALRTTEYDEFVHRITSRTSLAGILMTPDAAFGHDRRGTPDAVAVLGARDGFDLVVVPPFELDGRSVRSSDIRTAIAAGDLATAGRLLGRPYSVVGDVGTDGALVFQMPVASPPAGSYRVTMAGVATGLSVESGTMRLDSSTASRGTQLSVEFAPGGESA
jgi:riboflavin kinase/FMN adenylyltransferase